MWKSILGSEYSENYLFPILFIPRLLCRFSKNPRLHQQLKKKKLTVFLLSLKTVIWLKYIIKILTLQYYYYYYNIVSLFLKYFILLMITPTFTLSWTSLPSPLIVLMLTFLLFPPSSIGQLMLLISFPQYYPEAELILQETTSFFMFHLTSHSIVTIIQSSQCTAYSTNLPNLQPQII